MASNDFAGVDERLRTSRSCSPGPPAEPVVVDEDELPRLPSAVEMYWAALALIGGDPAAAIARARAGRSRPPPRATT